MVGCVLFGFSFLFFSFCASISCRIWNMQLM
jgi:hypothetical protein